MSQDINKIHTLYEEFVTNMRVLAPKVDAILLLKAMRLEKMFPGDSPHAHLEIDFTDEHPVAGEVWGGIAVPPSPVQCLFPFRTWNQTSPPFRPLQ